MRFPSSHCWLALLCMGSIWMVSAQGQIVMQGAARPGPGLGPRHKILDGPVNRGAFATSPSVHRLPAPRRLSRVPAPDALEHSETPREIVDYQENLRQSTAQRLAQRGITVDPSRHTKSELEEILLKVNLSNQLKEYGANYSWQSYSLPELQQELQRREKISALERKGVPLDWNKLALNDLVEIENRMTQAARVSKLGRPVDWRNHSLAELKEMELRYYRLRRD